MIDFIKSITVKAGEMFYEHLPVVVEHDGTRGNWVAVEDIAIESFLTKKIKDNFHNHQILSREISTVIDDSPLSNSKTMTYTPENLWIIHPLDGTANAVYGFPHFAVSVAYLHNGEVKAAAAYDIPNKILYFAEKGKGAFIQDKHNITKLQVRNDTLDRALICTGSPHLRRNFQLNLDIMEKVLAAGARIVILGCSAMGGGYVAEGKLSLYYMRGLKPWHMATNSLLVSEAGGIATSFDGKITVLKPDTYVCGNKKIVDDFLKLV